MPEKLSEKELQRRVTALILSLALVFSFLGGRLAYLQLVQGEYWSRLSEGNRIRLVPLRSARGAIYDTKQQQLVTSRPAYSVSLVVMNKQIARSTALKVAEITGLDKDDMLARIERSAGRLYEPVRIASDISPDVHTRIEEAKADLPGVVIDVEPIREYIHGTVAAHVLGYVGEIRERQLQEPRYASHKMGDIIGQVGVEAYYDSVLRGVDGGRQVEVDYKGRPTPREMGRIEPQPGNDLVLTLDLKLQKAAELVLQQQLHHLQTKGGYPNAKAASLVALDVRTGGVLAMVSLPAYDLNEFARGISSRRFAELQSDPMRPFNNRAISGTYPPGSTFKMVTALAALEERKTTPGEVIYDSGRHPIVPSLPCHLKSGHGAVNMESALKVSCNIYFYEMGRRLGVDLIAKWGKKLGLGVRTGIDLFGEAQGLMPTTEWKRLAFQQKSPAWMREGEFLLAEHMMAGMGQVYHTYTPLQMASFTATLANGGTRYVPHFLKAVVDTNGRTIQEYQPIVADRLGAGDSSIHAVQRGMWQVTKPGGTAGVAFWGFPIDSAGKTGTAENPHGDDHAWYVGYAPYNNPEVAFAILVEQGGSGSGTAAPVARQFLEHYFGLAKEEAPKPKETAVPR